MIQYIIIVQNVRLMKYQTGQKIIWFVLINTIFNGHTTIYLYNYKLSHLPC